MFTSYIFQILMYIVLIGLLHYLYLFFRNNLTTPKVIDLVKRPTTEYQKMYDTIKQTKQSDEMKNELKDYFKNLNKSSNSEDSSSTIHSLTSSASAGTSSTGSHSATGQQPRKGNQASHMNPNVPSNNISLEYSNLNQSGGSSIPYSTF